MDDVVDGHLILSRDKSSRWATGEQTPQHRRRKDTSTNANSPSSYPLSLRINAWNQTAKLLSRNISATTTRTAALARNDPLEANSFAVETDNFSSSPLMVQQFFFERSQ
jgi:hypothetical protein